MKSGRREEKEEEEEEETEDNDNDDDACRYMPSSKGSVHQRPAISVVNKGPKKLVLKKTGAASVDEQVRSGGEMVTLVRGKKNRKFVLFKLDNFNCGVKKAGVRNNLVHHLSQVETHGPPRLPSSLFVKPLLNR